VALLSGLRFGKHVHVAFHGGMGASNAIVMVNAPPAALVRSYIVPGES
jgi:hypothetical protein